MLPYGRKNPLPFPLFAAVTCRQSAPDYSRERGDSQEGGNRRCLPSCAPARRQRTFPRSAERNSPLNLSEKTPARQGRTRLRQFASPAQSVQRNRLPPGKGEPACGSSCAPVSRCRKAPGSTRDKNFQENMRYPLAKYARIGYYIQALFCMNSRMMLNDVKNTIIWRHSDYDRR